MSTDETGPTNSAELQAELQTLLIDAYENGVPVEGGWNCRNGDGHPDWDVMITQVQKPDQ